MCYTHVWFGLRRDENGKWIGVKEGKNYDLMVPLMTIAQHANKEFPLLAGILPELYAKEGHKVDTIEEYNTLYARDFSDFT